ncbi:PREDICTED: uncharacterized protein LOC101362930 [Odobenus rosmarus divergens]|uniref:Uncharacterized protein LOC101362930 n=1 Tax=Odobenus rosmarus divergens TaxID=9708 RepID=A0A9B0GPR8_ODORO
MEKAESEVGFEGEDQMFTHGPECKVFNAHPSGDTKEVWGLGVKGSPRHVVAEQHRIGRESRGRIRVEAEKSSPDSSARSRPGPRPGALATRALAARASGADLWPAPTLHHGIEPGSHRRDSGSLGPGGPTKRAACGAPRPAQCPSACCPTPPGDPDALGALLLCTGPRGGLPW